MIETSGGRRAELTFQIVGHSGPFLSRFPPPQTSCYIGFLVGPFHTRGRRLTIFSDFVLVHGRYSHYLEQRGYGKVREIPSIETQKEFAEAPAPHHSIMGAATPLDHDAHRSPAMAVDANCDGELRRKSESECGILGTKIPGSIAVRPGIISKRPPAKVCAIPRYQVSNALAIYQEIGPASNY
jgi:hypothetical protein